MNKILRGAIALSAVFFIGIALRWLIDPAGAAEFLGMPLLEGRGLSSQLGDFTAFFLSLGACMTMGVISQKAHWFYAPLLLLALTAVFRVSAWLIHDAALALDMIAPEVIISSLLIVGIRSLNKSA